MSAPLNKAFYDGNFHLHCRGGKLSPESSCRNHGDPKATTAWGAIVRALFGVLRRMLGQALGKPGLEMRIGQQARSAWLGSARLGCEEVPGQTK